MNHTLSCVLRFIRFSARLKVTWVDIYKIFLLIGFKNILTAYLEKL